MREGLYYSRAAPAASPCLTFAWLCGQVNWRFPFPASEKAKDVLTGVRNEDGGASHDARVSLEVPVWARPIPQNQAAAPSQEYSLVCQEGRSCKCLPSWTSELNWSRLTVSRWQHCILRLSENGVDQNILYDVDWLPAFFC